MIYIKKNLDKFVLATFVFFWPAISLAVCVSGDLSCSNTSTPTIVNPLANNGTNTLPDLIQKILTGAIKIGIPIIVLAIIYCGFLFVSAQGNTEKLGEAKRALLYTLIGAAILLGSLAIAQLITDTVHAL